MQIQKFNIRVYGILINNQNQVLVCDELIKGHNITKFPGGGLEFGEGTLDCLKREFIEETNTPVEIVKHFYTTDFFVPSAYNPSHQIISIYYLVKPIAELKIKTSTQKNDFIEDNIISFRWIDIDKISENDFTLPIDRIVGKALSNSESFN